MLERKHTAVGVRKASRIEEEKIKQDTNKKKKNIFFYWDFIPKFGSDSFVDVGKHCGTAF